MSDSNTKVNENLPLPHFPAKIEKQFRDELISNAKKNCVSFTEMYVDCARNRTFSIAWACRKQLNDMNNCMKQYTNEAEHEKLKKRWMEENKVFFK